MGWVSRGDDRRSTLDVLPKISTAFDALYLSLWCQQHIPAAVLELCRLRLAQLHRCDLETQRQECAISDDKRENLVRWDTHGSFSAPERACLAFTEVYAMDAQALTDAQADDVKEHFSEAGLVLLIEALGIFDGMTRLSLLWQLPAKSAAENVSEPAP